MTKGVKFLAYSKIVLPLSAMFYYNIFLTISYQSEAANNRILSFDQSNMLDILSMEVKTTTGTLKSSSECRQITSSIIKQV